MKLLELEIDNFRVIRQARLRFPDMVIGIVGANGTGKSSLVEAVAWALYGQKVARSGKEEIRSIYAPRGEECRVALGFELEGEQYRLVRKLLGKNDRTEVTLTRGGKQESVGTVETERYVIELLGLDWRGFLTSFLARQQELNALADLAANKRRDQLAGMLGVDRLDRALKKVKEDRKLQAEKITFLQQQLAGRPDLQARLTELGEHIKQLVGQEDSLSGALSASRARSGELEKQYREHQEKQVVCSHLEATLAARQETREQLAQRLEELTLRASTLNNLALEAAQLENITSGWKATRTEHQELVASREKASRYQQILVQKNEVAGERQALDRELEERQQALSEVVKELVEIGNEIEEQVKQVTGRLETARHNWSNCQAESRTNERAINLVREQLMAIEKIGSEAVCDRCHRPFGDDLPAIREHLQNELDQAEKVGRELTQRLTELKATGDELKRIEAETQKRAALRQTLLVRRETLKRELGAAQARQVTVSKKLDRINQQLTELGEINFDAKRLAEVEASLKELEAARNRLLQIEGELKARPEVDKDLVAVQDKLAVTDREAEQLKKELAELGFDAQAFGALTLRFNQAREALEKATQAHLRCERDLELARQEQSLKEKELARLDKAGNELEECREDQFHLEKLISLFTEFRKFTISRIRPRLAELASQLFSEMSGGRYSLVELDEDYNLRIMDGGQFYGVDRFSGGEKDLASLCLRLAISLALTESAGLARSFVILDEVFGSQDAGRRELIFESLARLKKRFPQIILITHLDELKNKVESLIELNPQPGGWSEVKANGQTA